MLRLSGGSSGGVLHQLSRLPAVLRAVAALLIGVLAAGAGSWRALEMGPGAVLVLAAVFVAALWAVRRHIELVSDAWPAPVPLPPSPAPVRIDDDEDDGDGEPDDQERGNRRPDRVESLLDLVPLPGGSFLLGSDLSSDRNSNPSERPQHPVRLSPFQIARTPVTRGHWRRVMAAAAESWRRVVPTEWRDGDDDLPATHSGWLDALAFCNAASVAEGLRPCDAEDGKRWTCDWDADGYRLPTEAEWEYACRAGATNRTPSRNRPAVETT